MSKAVLVMDMPESCEKCFFHACKYSLPLSTYRKGLYCQLDAEKEVFDMDYNDYEFKSEKCPIHELPEYKSTYHGNVKTNSEYEELGKKIGWNACLDAITDGK